MNKRDIGALVLSLITFVGPNNSTVQAEVPKNYSQIESCKDLEWSSSKKPNKGLTVYKIRVTHGDSLYRFASEGLYSETGASCLLDLNAACGVKLNPNNLPLNKEIFVLIDPILKETKYFPKDIYDRLQEVK